MILLGIIGLENIYVKLNLLTSSGFGNNSARSKSLKYSAILFPQLPLFHLFSLDNSFYNMMMLISYSPLLFAVFFGIPCSTNGLIWLNSWHFAWNTRCTCRFLWLLYLCSNDLNALIHELHTSQVKVVTVGKYTGLSDAYLCNKGNLVNQPHIKIVVFMLHFFYLLL